MISTARTSFGISGSCTARYGVVVVGVYARRCIVPPGFSRSSEGTLLDIDIALIAATHTAIGYAAAVEAVQDVNLSEADTGYTLLAALIPPAVDKRGV